MRPVKWMALLLALCLLASTGAVGLTEDAMQESANLEAAVEPADTVDAATGLVVDDGTDTSMPIDTDALDDAIEALGAGDDLAVDAPLGMSYVEVAAAEAPVYQKANDAEAEMLLHAGDLVLSTGESGYYTAVAFYADGKVKTGFMQTCDLISISDAAVQAQLDAAAASGSVALYGGDINWPLVPLKNVSYGDDRIVSAVYTTLSDSTKFVMNGKEFSAKDADSKYGTGQCWKWSNSLYKKIWGCEFESTFAGKSATGLNLVYNLNDEQRKLTPEHLKVFILNTVPGATLRICACSSKCHKDDDVVHGHKMHSMIVAGYTNDGLYVMDNASNHTRYYTWKNFCKGWDGYTYVKYIKWPGAQPLPADAIPLDGTTPDPTTTVTNTPVSNVAVTGVKLDQSELTLDEGGTAKLVATVEPANATDASVTWSSSDDSIAKVENGAITAVKAGSVKITVKTKDGGKTATCTVTVKTTMRTKALTKTGSNGTIKLAPGEQVQLTADFATKRGWKLKSAKSSKKKYASIDSSGIVTARAVGTTKITVKTKNGKKATLKVVVEDPSVPSSVKLNKKGTVKMKVGQTLKLQAAVKPTTATTTYTWGSSKSKIAYVDQDGNVTALKKGTCYVGVRTANGKIAKVKIKVKKK